MADASNDQRAEFVYVPSALQAGRPSEQAFLDACAELNYFPRQVNPDQDGWPSIPPVIFIDSAADERQGIPVFPRRHDVVAGLGVLSPGVGVSETMSTRCADILSWPCTSGELEFRMSRVSVKSESDNAALIRDLMWRCNLIGDSVGFLNAMTELQSLARCDAHILLTGETGTGKELAARAVHYSSNLKDGPFVPVNCAALPRGLLENELFGHERGAFTDARTRQRGLVAQADGGTLFLDEVNTLDAHAQAALLRFLQDGSYRPLGGAEVRANVRIVAATNQDLGELVRLERFREDLRYRLEVLTCTLPPLRDRDDDVLVLARHFARQYCSQYNLVQKPLHPDFECWIHNHTWPGNVRELENCIHRAVVLSMERIFVTQNKNAIDGGLTNPAAIAPREEPFSKAKARVLASFEISYLRNLMKRAGGNVSLAARLAGKERRALGRLLKKHGLR